MRLEDFLKLYNIEDWFGNLRVLDNDLNLMAEDNVFDVLRIRKDLRNNIVNSFCFDNRDSTLVVVLK